MCSESVVWFVVMLHYCSIGLSCGNTYPTLTELCPSRKFCRSDAIQELDSEKYDSCCQPCSCSSDCFTSGNCCPDVQIGIGDVPAPAAQCLSTIPDDIFNNPVLLDNGFKMITSCPPMTNVSNQVIELCKSPVELLDRVPVSTMDGNMLFKNQHCAHCYGHNEIVFWQLYDELCSEMYAQEFTNMGERDLYLQQKCQLAARPPSYAYAQKVFCQTKVIDSCNSTQLWDQYNADVEAACHNEITPYTNSIFMQDKPTVKESVVEYFANAFCYLCNRRNVDINLNDTCLKYYISSPKLVGTVSMTTLLDLQPKRVLQLHQPKRACGSTGEIFDIYTKECRQVACGFAMVPDDGTCRPLGRTAGMVFKAIFSISDVVMSPTKANTRDAFNAIDKFDDLLDSGDLLKCQVFRCQTLFYNDDKQGLYFISYTITTETCPLHEAIRAFQKFHALDLDAQMASGTLNMTLALVTQSTDSYIEHKSYIEHTVQDRCQLKRTPVVVTQDLLQLCPRVRLVVQELREKVSNETVSSLMKARIDSFESTITNDTFVVCLSDYTTAMERERATNSATHLSQCFMVYLVLSLLECYTIHHNTMQV